MPNVSKLVKWNLSQPFEKRIAYGDLVARVELAPTLYKLRALHQQIHKEIETEKSKIEKIDHWAL